MRIIKVLATISLVCFLITFDITIFFSKTYFQLFWEQKDLNKVFQIIDFFKGSNVSFLNGSEMSHLMDVKRILNFLISLRDVSLACFVFSLAFLHVNKEKIELRFVFFSLLVLNVFCLCFAFFFENFFIVFHKVLFPKGNWEFPASSELIRLFPKDFWFTVFIHFIVLIFLETVVILVMIKCRGWDLNPGTD